MKTMRKISSLIAGREGKKSNARIGDIMEILAIYSDLVTEDPTVATVLENNGIRRKKRRNKKLVP